MIEFAEDEPKWEQIVAVIQQRIESGEYPPRTRVPSVQQIVAETGVSVDTAQKALVGLRDQGWTYTRRGMGSFVTPPEDRSQTGKH